MRDASDIKRWADKLRSRYSLRDERYINNWYAYNGQFDMLASGYSSSPLKLKAPQGSEPQILVWNLVRPIVDTKTTLINRLPSIKVPEPVMDDPLAGAKADKMEKVLYATWGESRMTRKHGEASFNQALQNCTVWFVRWDDERGMPIVTVRSPGETYPVFKRNNEEVEFCIFRWEEEADALAENYPEAKKALGSTRSDSKVEVLEYVDSDIHCLVIAGQTCQLGSHSLGVCPVVVCPGIWIPGDFFPPGQVDQIVQLNDYVNRFQTKLGKGIEEVIFGRHILSGEGAENAAFNSGPGAVVRLPEGVNYAYSQPQPPPSEAFAHIQQVMSIMRTIATFPESASGEMSGSIITGKAVSRLQGVMSGQAAVVQDNMGEALATCNEFILRMFEKYGGKKKYRLYSKGTVTQVSAPGTPSPFTVTIIPEEDIQGYYNNQLIYSPFGTDLNATLQVGMQLVSSHIWSERHLREQIPGSGDSDGMEKQIENEMRRRMQIEVDLQTAAQERIMQKQAELQQQQAAQGSAGGEQSGDAGSGPSASSLASPGSPPSGAQGGEMVGNTMVMPGGQPSMAGLGEPMTGQENFPLPYTALKPFNQATDVALGKTQGAPEEGGLVNDLGPNALTIEQVKQILAGVQKLKGEVYIGGELAKSGVTEGTVTLYITNKLDKATIANATRETPLAGRIEFIPVPEGKIPPNAVPLKGGANAQSAQAA